MWVKCADDFLQLGTARVCGSSVTKNEKETANGLARRMKNEPLNNTKSAKWIKRARGSFFFPDNGRFHNVREELGRKRVKSSHGDGYLLLINHTYHYCGWFDLIIGGLSTNFFLYRMKLAHVHKMKNLNKKEDKIYYAQMIYLII